MFTEKRYAILLAVLVWFISVEIAYTNGINPPRPSSANIVSAVVYDKSGGKQHKIYRARIIYNGKSIESLKFRIDGATEQIAITDIRAITFTKSKLSPDGFVNAMLVRSEGTEEIPVMVKVKANNKVITLAGFEESGTRVNINLTKCKRVEFSAIATPNDINRPVEMN